MRNILSNTLGVENKEVKLQMDIYISVQSHDEFCYELASWINELKNWIEKKNQTLFTPKNWSNKMYIQYVSFVQQAVIG